MLNVREEALIAQKRTCLYHLSAAALILLKDQEKRKKEQVKEEISPPKKRKQVQCGLNGRPENIILDIAIGY